MKLFLQFNLILRLFRRDLNFLHIIMKFKKFHLIYFSKELQNFTLLKSILKLVKFFIPKQIYNSRYPYIMDEINKWKIINDI